MTLSKWIEDYCEDNEIELPSGIPDEKTALSFLCLNKSEGGGGGGSSDFSTAEVIVTNNTNTAIMISALVCIELGEDLVTGAEVMPNSSLTVEVVLYKNNASLCNTEAEASVVTTGDIVYDDEYGDFYITGAGTITFS